ncbi:unnamed protein product [Linum tenue]|uniref:Transcription repressor n=1 Tax=Linum tenue TaxID=586396 RepID=A0AAV0P717_9ROSI|nr:unnamed protein product [Linum tenue]
MPTLPFFWRNLLLQCLPTTAPAPFPSEPAGPDPPHPPYADATSSIAFDIPSSAATSSEYPEHSDHSRPPPDFAAAFASRRFFFSSPGLSNSISKSHRPVEEVNPPSSRPPPVDGGVVAVRKYSPDPYSDFKKSMEEMIESRRIVDARGNWDYLHQLLSCYLAMNPKHTHGYIVSAFADTVVRLLPSPAPILPPSSSSDATVRSPEAVL